MNAKSKSVRPIHERKTIIKILPALTKDAHIYENFKLYSFFDVICNIESTAVIRHLHHGGSETKCTWFQ